MKKSNLMPLNLQYFADPASGEPGADDNGGQATQPTGSNPNEGGQQGVQGGDPQAKASEPKPKYTDAQVNAIIDKKFAKWKDEQAAKDAEAKKLADMNTNQKKDYELEKANKAAAEAKAEVARYQMTATARQMAADADVSLTDADLGHLVTEDADSTKANMDWLVGLKERIEADVKKEYLSGKAPKAGGDSLNGKTGAYAERLAKQKTQRAANPYFKKN